MKTLTTPTTFKIAYKNTATGKVSYREFTENNIKDAIEDAKLYFKDTDCIVITSFI